MINGVLVERTVGDVLPQLQSNSDNMNKVLVELAKQYKTKQDDMEKWKVRHSFSSPLILARIGVKNLSRDHANHHATRRKRTRSRLCSNKYAHQLMPAVWSCFASYPEDERLRHPLPSILLRLLSCRTTADEQTWRGNETTKLRVL